MTDVPRSDAATTPAPAGSPDLPDLDEFLVDQTRTLLDTARRSVRPEGGFWWLTDDRTPDRGEPLHTWITCRMTHVVALAHRTATRSRRPRRPRDRRAQHAAARRPVRRLVRARGPAGRAGRRPQGRRTTHAFVAAGRVQRRARPAGRARERLLDDALTVVRERFWDDDAGRSANRGTADWTVTEDYRGANSSMHMVEAFLAAAAATGDPSWADRALRISAHLMHGEVARARLAAAGALHRRLGAAARLQPEQPADPFRPYGSTIGHCAGVVPAAAARGGGAAAAARGCSPTPVRCSPPRCGGAGRSTARTASSTPSTGTTSRWSAPGCTGCSPRPSARPITLHQRTGDAVYATWYRVFWEFARRNFIDRHRDGGTSWTRRTCPPTRSGTADRTSTTPTRRYCCPAAADGLGGPARSHRAR